MKQKDLIAAFKAAKENKNGICVEVKIPGQKTTEKIINDYEALDTKLIYYAENYDDELRHLHNKEVKIVRAYPCDFYTQFWNEEDEWKDI